MNTPEGLDYVHIRTLLAEMRKCRLGLVQAPEQLRFVYQSVIEALDSDWEADNEVNNIIINKNCILCYYLRDFGLSYFLRYSLLNYCSFNYIYFFLHKCALFSIL